VTRGAADRARTERFEAVFGRVYEPLQRYLRRRADPTTAEDVLSETLTTIWRRLDDVPADLELAWCYSVARHTLGNSRRSRDRHLRLVERVGADGRARPTESAPADAGIETTDPELDRALAALAPDDREVLRLWAWEQLEAREIAAVLDITPNAASIRLHRAKGHLREALGAERTTAGPDTDGSGPGGQNR
jgi:RNA polymerase sigma-70 factor, ECF subfamily